VLLFVIISRSLDTSAIPTHLWFGNLDKLATLNREMITLGFGIHFGPSTTAPLFAGYDGFNGTQLL